MFDQTSPEHLTIHQKPAEWCGIFSNILLQPFDCVSHLHSFAHDVIASIWKTVGRTLVAPLVQSVTQFFGMGLGFESPGGQVLLQQCGIVWNLLAATYSLNFECKKTSTLIILQLAAVFVIIVLYHGWNCCELESTRNITQPNYWKLCANSVSLQFGLVFA